MDSNVEDLKNLAEFQKLRAIYRAREAEHKAAKVAEAEAQQRANEATHSLGAARQDCWEFWEAWTYNKQ